MQTIGNWNAVKRDLRILLDRLFELPDEDFYDFDSLLSVNDLENLGYPRNFPHLTCMLCSIRPELHEDFSNGRRNLESIQGEGHIQFGLLPAACYRIYLDRSGTSLRHPSVIGCEARCYRFEDKPLDSYRAYNFTMKEFVYLGTGLGASEHIQKGQARISGLLNLLEITHTAEVASDPFFDRTSSVATLSRALPTKTEIVFEGHAISSLNVHRSYFGTKFNIDLEGDPVSTSCVAFGIERWLSMLEVVFGEPRRASAALAAASSSLAAPVTQPEPYLTRYQN